MTNDIKQWLSNNIWNLLTFVVAIIIGWSYLQTTVRANAQAIAELRGIVNEYPSEDFFIERFKNIDQSINDLKEDLKDVEKKVDDLPHRI